MGEEADKHNWDHLACFSARFQSKSLDVVAGNTAASYGNSPSTSKVVSGISLYKHLDRRVLFSWTGRNRLELEIPGDIAENVWQNEQMQVTRNSTGTFWKESRRSSLPMAKGIALVNLDHSK